MLDVACGGGRHTRLFAERGCAVVAVDREPRLDPDLQAHARVDCRVADLEQGPWPLAGERFDAIVVTNYLSSPAVSSPARRAALRAACCCTRPSPSATPRFGKPGNPAFLLAPRELLDAFAGLRVIAFEDGYEASPAAGDGAADRRDAAGGRRRRPTGKRRAPPGLVAPRL